MQALVVPAFELVGGQGACKTEAECGVYRPDVPRSFAGLLRCIREDRCSTFYSSVPLSHSTTGYAEWIRAGPHCGYDGAGAEGRAAAVGTGSDSSSLTVGAASCLRPIHCFDSLRYEPYLVIRRGSSIPLFEERFNGC